MKSVFISLIALLAFGAAGAQTKQPELETVAALPMRPGNVAVSKNGRIFATIHALGSKTIQLIEVKSVKDYVSFPSADLQKNGRPATDALLDAPLGLTFDKNDELWVIDMGQDLGKTRIWHFDIKTGKVKDKIDLPENIAPKGSFIQDIAIDEGNHWAYLADIANPGIIAVNLKTKETRRFGGHPALQTEDVDMVIDGKVTYFGGKPARVAINPITLSADRDTLFFGAMNGTTWYSVPAKLFRDGAGDAVIGKAIQPVGKKPISDGAATADNGYHYFTNLSGHAISRLTPNGELTDIITVKRLLWPDNVAIRNGYVYISANQLNTTPAFTGAGDEGKPPYYIYRFKIPAE